VPSDKVYPKWTKERILEAIRERQRKGLPLTAVYKDDLPLFAAAARYCGSWCQALLAAGLPAKPPRKWTPAIVIATLQMRHQQGLPMDLASLEDGGLVHAAHRRFGTWGKALAAAGITIPSHRKWTREIVLAQLRAGGPWRTPPRREEVPAILAQAAYRFFPAWHDVLAAAGFVPLEPRPSPPRKWTKQSVIDEIRARHRQGLPLNVNASYSLTNAAVHRFGTWSKAMAAAGLAARQYRRWSKERILQQLRDLNERGTFDRSTRWRDSSLVEAARLQFGGWSHALRLAGVLAPQETCRNRSWWTPQQVIEAIQDLHVRGAGLIAKKNMPLAMAARKHFGGWSAAFAAAGLARQETHR
jgi:hypothetical protein